MSNENLTRKIHWTAFKSSSGKWYAEGDAFIDPCDYYFNEEGNKKLLKDIDSTQTELSKDSISNGNFIIVVDDLIDSGPFMKRLIFSRE